MANKNVELYFPKINNKIEVIQGHRKIINGNSCRNYEVQIIFNNNNKHKIGCLTIKGNNCNNKI